MTGDSLITRPLRIYCDEPFLSLRSLIRNSDVAFTNLETIFHTYNEGYPAAESGGIHLATHPSLAEDLQWFGFNLLGVATNHSMDWSAGGLFKTVEVLKQIEVSYAGIGNNLAEARAPAYLETAMGRVALISTTSTFPSGANAGAQRNDIKGRPGVNPLRFATTYTVSPVALQTLKEISKTLGLETIKERRRAAGFPVDDDDVEFHFLGHKFVDGDPTGIRTKPDEVDMHANLRMISEARRQSDWVFVSLHAHEAQVDRENPAEFIKVFARACIDSGADAVLGHGPHLLRGIELYEKKPIFYSLGNFIFQNETVQWLPADDYDMLDLGSEATPADIADARTVGESGTPIGFVGDRRFWESVLAVCKYQGRELDRIELYPLTLGFGNPRTTRGRPHLASGSVAQEIIQRMVNLSAPFGTDIEVKNEQGIIRVL
jgi:poly-gamma-glutamate capsule biosynthesis protein CapA/YwtB (metallophosphatase superfamily)